MDEWKEDKPKSQSSQEDGYCFTWDDENIYI